MAFSADIASMNPKSSPFELGKNRIEALSDGIFAIVMTLLILEIHAPELPAKAANVVVLPELIKLWPKFVAYFVSFVSLGVFWIGHHKMYHAVRSVDSVLLWLNILFFMFVSMLPFSTSLLNAFPHTQVAPLFFGANLAGIGWLLWAQWAYTAARSNMLSTFVSRESFNAVKSRMFMIPLATTFTVLICFWSVKISLAIYLMLLPWYMLPGKFDRLRSQTS
jgi:uncharacterized membrane protein